MKRTPQMTGSCRGKNSLSCLWHVRFWVQTLPFISGDIHVIWAVRIIFQKGSTETQSVINYMCISEQKSSDKNARCCFKTIISQTLHTNLSGTSQCGPTLPQALGFMNECKPKDTFSLAELGFIREKFPPNKCVVSQDDSRYPSVWHTATCSRSTRRKGG